MNSEIIAPQSATIGSDSVREHSKFLIFSVNYEEYGVDIMTVREIKGWGDTTRLPNSPAYVRGVMNLRGVIVPIFDLRARFTGILTETTPKHVMIVLMAGERMVSILADTVSDIITANREDMKCAPDTETTIEQRYITGLIAVDQRMVVVLDIEKLLGKPLTPKP
ncbi:MAG: purine-binding chemotaxis protein CheW [Alphaproteobacteria bacterium]|nr:MAG: purine-binding chemotaxis protein CheW [Alphaproteobacteria bacterium]TAF14136.1 MAG: purine-binding chemotaxis protein CheW [Alphaproteobacteria bacterium]TAF39066.1 MAG: purine-binding chemotaxis protein CheW [Alphaproteobacteria bacterium]TAF75222.1 MAG: purine-binding chemotaxis protein CheW [Alphaproteobacteria bacterium]